MPSCVFWYMSNVTSFTISSTTGNILLTNGFSLFGYSCKTIKFGCRSGSKINTQWKTLRQVLNVLLWKTRTEDMRRNLPLRRRYSCICIITLYTMRIKSSAWQRNEFTHSYSCNLGSKRMTWCIILFNELDDHSTHAKTCIHPPRHVAKRVQNKWLCTRSYACLLTEYLHRVFRDTTTHRIC